MLNVIRLIDQTFMEIDGKLHMVGMWNAPISQILEMNGDKDVYIYKPTLHSNTPQGFVIKRTKR
jgi:hypothetical protein